MSEIVQSGSRIVEEESRFDFIERGDRCRKGVTIIGVGMDRVAPVSQFWLEEMICQKFGAIPILLGKIECRICVLWNRE
jgi:hypothetical protein